MTMRKRYTCPMSTPHTEPITHADALLVGQAVHNAARSVTRCMWRVADGVLTNPYHLRVTADWLEAMGTTLGVDEMRRAADQIDPPEPATPEPDFTTPEGWIAEAERADDWTEMPTPASVPQYVALVYAVDERASTQAASDRLTSNLDHACRNPYSWINS